MGIQADDGGADETDAISLEGLDSQINFAAGISLENECLAHDWIIRYVETLLEAYPTSLEEDEARMADDTLALSYHQRLLLLFHLEERRLMRLVVDAFCYMKDWLVSSTPPVPPRPTQAESHDDHEAG